MKGKISEQEEMSESLDLGMEWWAGKELFGKKPCFVEFADFWCQYSHRGGDAKLTAWCEEHSTWETRTQLAFGKSDQAKLRVETEA